MATLGRIIEITKNGNIKPEVIRCVYCGSNAYIHDYTAGKAPMKGYKVDVHYKCANCSFFHTFGVPITEDEFKKITNKWIFRHEDKEEIKERLKKFGYW